VMLTAGRDSVVVMRRLIYDQYLYAMLQ